jgi:putative phosphoesterase
MLTQQTSRIGIISDTHEDIRMINRAVKILRERSPALVVHCGDIISPPVLESFKGLPMRFVFGNNDGERSGLRKKCQELNFEPIEETSTFTFDNKRFFVNHGTRSETINDAIATQSYDYILHGHTHEQRNQVIGNTRVINPGALFSAEIYSIAFLDPSSGVVEFVEIPDHNY